MKTLKLFFVLLTVISFTSCEDVIQVKLDEGDPIVTIDAFVNDMRSTQKIRLTYTDDYFSQKPNYSLNARDKTISTFKSKRYRSCL